MEELISLITHPLVVSGFLSLFLTEIVKMFLRTKPFGKSRNFNWVIRSIAIGIGAVVGLLLTMTVEGVLLGMLAGGANALFKKRWRSIQSKE